MLSIYKENILFHHLKHLKQCICGVDVEFTFICNTKADFQIINLQSSSNGWKVYSKVK